MLMMIDTRFCCAHIHEHCITQLLKHAATRVHQACTTARTNRMYTRFATLYPPRKAYTVEFCRAARNLLDRPLRYVLKLDVSHPTREGSISNGYSVTV